MKIVNAIAFLVVAFLSITANAAPVQVSDSVLVDVLESVPVRELWNSAVPHVAKSEAAIVDYRMFDPEARPRNGKWCGCAVLMIGTGDVGIKPVAVRVWTARPCSLAINGERSGDSHVAAQFNVEVGAKQSFKIRVTDDLGITMNGRPIGRIED